MSPGIRHVFALALRVARVPVTGFEFPGPSQPSPLPPRMMGDHSPFWNPSIKADPSALTSAREVLGGLNYEAASAELERLEREEQIGPTRRARRSSRRSREWTTTPSRAAALKATRAAPSRHREPPTT